MKKIFVILIVFLFYNSTALAQNLLVNGMIGFPTNDYAFSSDNEIKNIAYGGSLGLEFNISKSFSGYFTAGITFLDQSTSSDQSSVVPVMAGIKYNMGAGGFLPYLGAEIGYNFISYDNFFGKELTLREPAVSVLMGLTLPLTSKIVWDIHGKYNLVLTAFRSNSMVSINTGFGFALN